MAIVVRYFSPSANGAGDGTTWANRAALFSGGNWSTVITNFDFSGSDSLECRIGPGTYTCGSALASGSFGHAPTAANPLILHGADSSGNRLTPPDPGWVSAQPAWDASGMPEITTTSDTATIAFDGALPILIKFTSSDRKNAILAGTTAIWCQVINACNGSSARASTGLGINCVFACTGAAFNSVVAAANHMNCRIEGVTGSAGNRRGMECDTGAGTCAHLTIVGCGGDGVIVTSTSTSQAWRLVNCHILNCGGTGFKTNNAANQSALYILESCLISGHGAYGVDAQSASRVLMSHNRMRDNASGNVTGLGNYPADLDLYTTDTDDATEFVNAAGGDYRISKDAATWGKGYGAGDEMPVGGSAGGGSLFGSVVR